ncbi:MAG TPA: hypothetical protein VH880_04785 [Anaeromyxobacteraceae bacterium]|jgi:hypothetical protein
MRRLALAALPFAAACGGPLLSAVVEIPYACVTQHLDVPPAAPVPQQFDLPAADLPLLPPLLRQGADLTLRVTEVDITAVTPGVDLGGIDSIAVRAVAPSGTPPPLEVAVYAKPSPPPPPPITKIVARGQSADVADYLQSGAQAGTVQIRVSGSGTPPAVPWQADLRVCVYGKGVIPYF